MKKKSGIKKSADSGFEEFIDLGNMWDNRHKLAEKTPTDLNWREHQMLAQSMFENGRTIEAFIILHGLIEIQLNQLWRFFIISSGIFDELRDLPKIRPYSDLADLLYDAGLLEKKLVNHLQILMRIEMFSHTIFMELRKKSQLKKKLPEFLKKGS